MISNPRHVVEIYAKLPEERPVSDCGDEGRVSILLAGARIQGGFSPQT